jgi:vitamin K-dependent gamma-carboxylase
MERRVFLSWLFAPVDNTPLVLFRIVFGILIALESAGSIATGWVHNNLIAPRVAFPMIGFDWVRPLPGAGMLAYYALMAACGLLVMLGRFYRASLAVFTVLWSATYVMQTVSYNNHYYLILLLALLLLPMPAHAWASLDARLDPALRSVTCPRWCIAALVAQTALVYGFAAIAKLDADGLAGRPLEIWLTNRADRLLGPLFVQPWMKWVLAYGGLVFDALLVPLLSWRRTRVFAFALAVVFHLFNSYTFRIGVFPYVGIALCLFFFPGEELRRRFMPRKPPVIQGPRAPTAAAPRLSGRRRLLLGALAVYFALQLALPLRHLLYPGNVHWTEEGHRMSWHMMLRSKEGQIEFHVFHAPSGRRWNVLPQEFLTEKQVRRVATRPDVIWQFAQFLKQHYAEQGIAPVEVRASSRVSLNGRPPQPLVDPNIDLAAQEWSFFRPSPWIIPLADSK